jgi:hypothetical protein
MAPVTRRRAREALTEAEQRVARCSESASAAWRRLGVEQWKWNGDHGGGKRPGMSRRLAIAVSQCTVCKCRKRKAVEAAITAGTSLRAIRKSFGLSPQALMRHRDRHMRPPREDHPPLRAGQVATDASGNVVIDGCGRVTYADGTGAASPAGNNLPTSGSPTGGPLLYPVRWWGPDTPRPGMGVRCEVCRGNEWWDIANWWGGCSYCWHPAITDGRKRTFRT